MTQELAPPTIAEPSPPTFSFDNPNPKFMLPKIVVKWDRIVSLKYVPFKKVVGKRPVTYMTVAPRGEGKSALGEVIAIRYRKIIDVLGCFDEETEILTYEGWKRFSDLTQKDTVATLDENSNIQYCKPSKIHKYAYTGDMIAIKGKVDFLVTPNHKMLVEKRTLKPHKERLFVRADEIFDYAKTHTSHHIPFHIPRAGKWNCSPVQYVELPMPVPQPYTRDLIEKYSQLKNIYHKNVVRKRNSNGTFAIENDMQTLKKISKTLGVAVGTLGKWANGKSQPMGFYHLRERKISIENFLPLLGWYLAEGSTRTSKKNKTSGIVFSLNNHNQAELNEVAKVINNAGFKPHIVKKYGRIYVHSAQLYEMFKPLGTSHKKYIPQWVKEQPTHLLELLISAMIKGDGNRCDKTKNDGCCVYTSVSKRLVDDLQEVCIKSGYATISNSRPARITEIDSRKIMCTESYTLTISRETNPQINRSLISKEHYQGCVYCVSVPPNKTVMVRRNGKAAWSGNSDDGESLCWLRPCFTEWFEGRYGRKPKILLLIGQNMFGKVLLFIKSIILKPRFKLAESMHH